MQGNYYTFYMVIYVTLTNFAEHDKCLYSALTLVQ